MDSMSIASDALGQSTVLKVANNALRLHRFAIYASEAVHTTSSLSCRHAMHTLELEKSRHNRIFAHTLHP